MNSLKITFPALMAALGALPEHPHIAVAVSGGPDSISLTFLLNDWVKQHNGTLHAFTVDHQLRAESRDEAIAVGRQCAAQNIPHEILTWIKDENPHSAVHQQARDARYALLFKACREKQIQHLFLAHHADDQAETVLMRLIKNSGADGLAGMPSVRTAGDIKLMRPLLPVRKQQLVELCEQNNWHYATDPSNTSENYMRGRLRNMSESLAAEGHTTEALYERARQAGMVRNEMEARTNEWLSIHASADAYGAIKMDATSWKSQSDDMKQRTLTRILLCVSAEDYAPRSASLETLIRALSEHEALDHTLSGCRIQYKDGIILVYREEDAIETNIPFQQNIIWDNRFKISVDNSFLDKTLSIAPLSCTSREQLEKRGKTEIAALPAYIRSALPALYCDGSLFDVPDFFGTDAGQRLVKAIFFPKRGLYSEPFHVPPPLLVPPA